MHEVERVTGQAAAQRVADHHLEVVQIEPAGETDELRVGVQADDAPVRADGGGEQLEDPAGAAAEVDRVLPWPHADPLEQGNGLRAQLLGLAAQPGALARAIAERVTGHRHDHLL